MDQDPKKLVGIPGELTSRAVEGIVSSASAIYDYDEQKFQSQINKEKANKILDGSVGNFVTFDASGNLIDSGKSEDSFSKDYNDLTNIPMVNDVSVYGSMTGADLGLVDASDGWGLSKNDYTDAEHQWVLSQMYGEIAQIAQENYKGTTDADVTTLIKDEDRQKTMTVTVTTKFFDTFVDSVIPQGWNGSNGAYTKDVTATTSSQTIQSATFTYTPSSGDYKDITVTYKSSAKTLSVIYPAYYGLISSNNKDTILGQANNLTGRKTSSYSNSNEEVLNISGEDKWFCILTRGTASAKQLGMSILTDSPYTNCSFYRNGFEMQGYKLYVSKNPISETIRVDLNITLQ